MKVSLLLVFLTVSGCSCIRVIAEEGQNITLPCIYNIKRHRPVAVCWNRGEIPTFGCDKTLISTDGVRVDEGSRVSSRYQLLGQLSRGDVSLTILNVTEDDATRYGCRVQIPGWLNDDKHHFDLSVVPRQTISPPQPSPSSSSSSSSLSSSSWATTGNETAGHMVSTATSLTESSNNKISMQEEGVGLTVILVGVVFGLVFLVTASGIFIMGRRWRKLNKLPQPQAGGSVSFRRSTSSTLQLHRQNSTVENIYQIDENEYNYCP